MINKIKAGNSVELKDWQSSVVECFEQHQDLVGEERFMSIPQFEINQKSCIKIKFPSGYGHTWLAAYLSAKYDSVVVYTDADHLKSIQNLWDNDFKNIGSGDRKAVSVYEIFYAVHFANMVQKTPDVIANLQNIQSKFKGKNVIVDDAANLPSIVEGWLMNTVTNALVFLN